MSKPTGEALIVNSDHKRLVFLAGETASTVKTLQLDGRAADVFLHVAGNTNIKVEATTDSHEAVVKGNAVFAAAKTFTATAVDGYLGSLKAGVTAIRITQSKQGTGTDDAGKLALIGGRASVVVAPVGTGGDTGIGAYTALASS